MKKYNYSKLTNNEINNLLKRPSIKIDDTFEVVKPMLDNIKKNGLSAVKSYAEKFDNFSAKELKVSQKEFESAESELSNEIKNAIESAYKNIYKFHELQFPTSYEIETQSGIFCKREFKPIENVGLYIPGGTAILPSTMLMLGIPAKIAGCKRIVAVSPTSEKIHPAILYAANLCGIKEFYKVGGAQAIGLLAFGTKEIQKVDKIFGPGNQFVTASKMIVSMDADGCAVDMPAGPSEVLVIADANANPDFVAADLLSQAEHGNDSQVILLTNSESLIDAVEQALLFQLENLDRKLFASEALKNSFSLLFEDIHKAVDFSNQYAPEHLIINCKNADEITAKIINAGSVFVGEYSPESVGDYASGTNHSLPTYGFAKAYSGLSVEAFMKSITFQKLTFEGLKSISRTVITLAETEKLDAHANAVKIRIQNGN